MEEQIDGAQSHPDLPIEAACPACGARALVQIKYNREFNRFMDFMGTQKEMKSLAGSYTYNGACRCPCGRLLRVFLSVTARDIPDAKKAGGGEGGPEPLGEALGKALGGAPGEALSKALSEPPGESAE